MILVDQRLRGGDFGFLYSWRDKMNIVFINVEKLVYIVHNRRPCLFVLVNYHYIVYTTCIQVLNCPHVWRDIQHAYSDVKQMTAKD
jgi:hypothetical protein